MFDIAVIILTKDEKLHIGRCLWRIAALSPRQVFVVDCFSTDGTQNIVWQNDKIGQAHFIISSADEFMRRALEKVEEWLADVSEERFVAALDVFLDEKLAAGEYRFKGADGRIAMRDGAIRFFREFSRKIVQLSDGRCVYFSPDERAKRRNEDNAVSWAEYSVHAVTNGGKRLPGKTYNERWLNYHKIEAFDVLESTLRLERCVVRRNENARYDAIMFEGDDVLGRVVNVITRLDDFGNIDASLTEVTFEASSRRVKKAPRLMPLAEAVETVVHRQVAAGSNPPTQRSIPNAVAERKGGCLVLVEHEWPGLQSVQFNWAVDNLPIEAKWILRLDADEYLTLESIEWLRTNLDRIDEKVSALEFTLERKFMGGEIRHGTNGIQMVRMFRRGRGRYAETLMDERIVFEGEKLPVPVVFYDDNLNSLDWWKEKHRGYAKREAQQAIESLKSGVWTDPRKAKYYKLPRYFRAIAYFCIRYFLKLGFLDGLAGFRWHFWQGLWYRWIVDREIGKMMSNHGKHRKCISRVERAEEHRDD